MSVSYKSYSKNKKVMKKYVNATEGSLIYSISKSRLMEMAKEANAIYKVGKSALINTSVFENYLLQFKAPVRPLIKHHYGNKAED